MPEHARRFIAPPYDQFEDEDRVADWGGDDLFKRTPRRRPRALALVEPPHERRNAAAVGVVEQRSGLGDRRRAAPTAEDAVMQRAERLGLSVVASPDPGSAADAAGASIAPAPGSGPGWDAGGSYVTSQQDGRVVGEPAEHHGAAPRALPIVRAERRPASWTPADWIRSRPERIVGWAFALGLLLILIAISTADAATL